MKHITLSLTLLITVSVRGQDAFVITPNGLTPQLLIEKVESLTQSDLYEKCLTWIEANDKDYRLSIEDQSVNQGIQLTSIKGNAVSLNDKFYHARYTVSINFVDGAYQFEPNSIQLKLNSKYDMGWKDFDLTDGTTYYKKGKVIKKYKTYIGDITVRLNELHTALRSYLKE